MTRPPPFDWTGGFTGACRVFEPLEEFEEFDELAEFDEPLLPELVPDEPEVPEPEPEPRVVEPLDAWLPEDEVPARELPEWVTAACVEPGRAAATAPAASTLAKPTVAVVAFSRRLPRSRSATALETSRLAACPGPVARGAPWRSSGLVMPSVLHIHFHGLFMLLLRTL